MLILGKTYRDGFDNEHRIVGQVPGRADIYYTDRGYWFFGDGRQHFRVSAEPSNYDLQIGDPAQVPNSTGTAENGSTIRSEH